MKSSWIQEKDLEELGYTKVIEAYKLLLDTMETASQKSNLADLKAAEVEKVKSKPGYKQMHVDRILHGQPQGLSPRVYAPIRELKGRLVNWGMVNKGGSPKASGAVFKYHDISIIEYYKQKALGFLNYYRPASNYHAVKKLVDYHLR